MYHGRSGILLDEESLPTFEYIIGKLNEYKLAYVHVSRPFWPVESAYLIDNVPDHFRKLYRGHLMVNGGYDLDSGEQELRKGNADSICYGQAFIANPDLTERIQNGHPWAEADKFTFYNGGPEGYTTYPVYKE